MERGYLKKVIKISFNGKTYNRTTNAQGIASLKLSNTSKYYTIKYSFSGDGYTSSKGSTKVLLIKKIINQPLKDPIMLHIKVLKTFTQLP